MKYAVFTVMLPDLTPEEATSELTSAGYDGVEWRVTRIAPELLHEAPSFWRNNRCTLSPTLEDAQRANALATNAGLAIPNLGTYLQVGDLNAAEEAMRFAQEAGSPAIRVGVARPQPGKRYQELYAANVEYLAAIELLALATRGLAAAAATPHPYDRYTAAQLAALRAAAGLVAQRAPATGRRRVTSVWKLLARTVPELGEWAVFFQSRSHNRVVTPGATGWVTSRDADDMLREAATFVELVAHCLGRHEDGIRALGDRLVCT